MNTLGPLTSYSNPPQIEILSLEKQTGKPQKYSFDRNIDELNANEVKTVLYNSVLKNYLSGPMYYGVVLSTILLCMIFLVLLNKNENKNNI